MWGPSVGRCVYISPQIINPKVALPNCACCRFYGRFWDLNHPVWQFWKLQMKNLTIFRFVEEKFLGWTFVALLWLRRLVYLAIAKSQSRDLFFFANAYLNFPLSLLLSLPLPFPSSSSSFPSSSPSFPSLYFPPFPSFCLIFLNFPHFPRIGDYQNRPFLTPPKSQIALLIGQCSLFRGLPTYLEQVLRIRAA